MIPRECRRLAEVDFPIAAVSKHAVAEQSLRRGHPKGLHKWWARRPLASSRAVLLALLLPDPADEHCPDDFRVEVRRRLVEVPQPAPWHYSLRSEETEHEGLRRILLGFIADFAAWGNASRPAFLKAARALVAAAHGEDRPQVVDPFAGGGSIPLEALRLGCDATATDLNPVACLILKTMLEDLPRAKPDLASEVRRVGEEIREEVRRELADLYPPDPDGSVPIAYLWARTVRCESPACGAEIPLLRSLWLSQKGSNRSALRPIVQRRGESPPRIEFGIFRPGNAGQVGPGTVRLARATCIACNDALPPERVRSQLASQRGGAEVVFDCSGRRHAGARLTAVLVAGAGGSGRRFRESCDQDYTPVRRAHALLPDDSAGSEEKEGIDMPLEPLPPVGTLGFRVQRYGMLRWRDMFTARQCIALIRFCAHVRTVQSDEVRTILALRVGAMADGNCSLSRWESTAAAPINLFARGAVQTVWDFCESTPVSRTRGVFLSGIDAVSSIVEKSRMPEAGQVQQADAAAHPLPDHSAAVWFTDPPYYDAIPYSDLSDFFLVWLRRAVPGHLLLRDPFDPNNVLSPKTREAVQDRTRIDDGRPKDREWFGDKMAQAFSEGRRVLRDDGVGGVVFAHKTTEGWEALLAGMIRGGWTITASWPIATEMAQRLRARDSAALATSVHLVCRPRPEDAGVGDWEDIRRQLPGRVSNWMKRLQGEGIRGADLVFACIGPALEIFSRHRAVETVDGAEVKLREYLERVWDTVGQAALQRVLGDDAGTRGDLEEDARLTALFLWTMQSSESEAGEEDSDSTRRPATGPYSLPFDVVRRFAQPMGIDLDAWTDRTIEMEKGVVRLLPVARRAEQIFGGAGAEASEPWGDGQQVSEQLALDLEWHRKQEAPDHRRNAPVLGPDARIRSAKATTLDRVHAAMLLQSGGRSQALRTLLTEETARGPDFLRLANALSALYPRGSEDKRLLDAMLLAVPR